ncbi:MAG: DUF218 domain-containing protein [Gaiellales bacterium]|nr:DUF218 domain-containing protein [Gaiellales bacterium]
MRLLTHIRRLLVSLLLLAVLLVAAVIVLNLAVIRAGRPLRISDPAQAAPATVAIVLGAQAYADGTPSPMLADRLRAAIDLYHNGTVQRLLLSGDHGRTTYDEVNAMKRFVLEAGVPAEDVFLDHAGFSTYETMYRARDVFQVTDAIVVTQAFHLDRALAIAWGLGLEARGVEAPCSGYVPKQSLLMREWLARCKAWLEVHVTRPLPTHLGEVIPISGDSRLSWD